MIVKELIKELLKLPQDKEVWIYRENGSFKHEYDATTLERVYEYEIEDKENNEIKDVVILDVE